MNGVSLYHVQRTLPPMACPYCGCVHQEADSIASSRELTIPCEGTRGVCAHCRGANIIDGGRLRKCGRKEFSERVQPYLQRLIERQLRAAIVFAEEEAS